MENIPDMKWPDISLGIIDIFRAKEETVRTCN